MCFLVITYNAVNRIMHTVHASRLLLGHIKLLYAYLIVINLKLDNSNEISRITDLIRHLHTEQG